MKLRTLPLTLLFLLSLVGPRLSAQQVDTMGLRPVRLDSISRQSPTTSGYLMTKDPTKATLLSIIPGLGQIYNESYLKAGGFALVAGFFVWRVISFNSSYQSWRAQADAVGKNDPTYSFYRTQREANRDARDLNAAYFLGVELLSMIDAYVGAHMFDFDVDDDLSSHIMLDPTQRSIGLSIRF